MKLNKLLTLTVLIPASALLLAQSPGKKSESVYTQKPKDLEAVFFTPENFNIKADGKTDVSDQLQEAINKVKTEKNFGIVFLPEGRYMISKTIHPTLGRCSLLHLFVMNGLYLENEC